MVYLPLTSLCFVGDIVLQVKGELNDLCTCMQIYFIGNETYKERNWENCPMLHSFLVGKM